MSAQQLSQMKGAEISADDRVDIAGIKIDMNAPAAMRAEQYLSQIQTPYAFKCGDVAVNVRFTAGGKALKDAIASYIGTLKKGP